MKKNPLRRGALTDNFLAIGTMTREMVHKRARKLAVFDGRGALKVSRADWDLAKQELMSEPRFDGAEAANKLAPESDRWNPVAGSTWHHLSVAGSEDEDADKRSLNKQLINECIAEANHEQMRKAAQRPATLDS